MKTPCVFLSAPWLSCPPFCLQSDLYQFVLSSSTQRPPTNPTIRSSPSSACHSTVMKHRRFLWPPAFIKRLGHFEIDPVTFDCKSVHVSRRLLVKGLNLKPGFPACFTSRRDIKRKCALMVVWWESCPYSWMVSWVTLCDHTGYLVCSSGPGQHITT